MALDKGPCPCPSFRKSQIRGKRKLNIQKTKIMASGPIISWEIDGETVRLYFFGPNQMVIAAMKLKDAYSLEGKL